MEATPTTPEHPATPPRRRAKFLAGGAVIVVALVGLIAWATARPGATSFYMTTSELLVADAPAPGSDYRINGKVVRGSIDTDGLETVFTITDGDAEVLVTTDRSLPDTFKDHSEVVARGTFDGQVFTATEVLAKCPSKFKAKA